MEMLNIMKQWESYVQELKDERDNHKKDYQRVLRIAEELKEENIRLKKKIENTK